MIKVIKVKLAELLEKDKRTAGKSYREAALLIGVDHVSLWKLANGKAYNPSFQMLDKLCNFLKVQPGDILEYKK